MALTEKPATAARPPAGALIDAALRGDVAGVRALLDAGADIAETDENGATALHLMGGRWASKEVADLLIERHAPLDAVDDKGLTPLLRALDATDDNRMQVRKLVKAGANLEIPDGDGNTPLMVAAKNGNEEMVAHLLAAGAVMETKNKAGQTAWDLALARREEAGMPGYLSGEILADLRTAGESRRRAAENEAKAAQKALRDKAVRQQQALRRTAPKVRL